MKTIRVVQYGLGPIGCAVARALLEKDGVKLVGAADIAPDKAAKDLAGVLGLPGEIGIRVEEDARVMQAELVWTHLLRQPLHLDQEELTVEVDHAVDLFDNALAFIAVQVEGFADA